MKRWPIILFIVILITLVGGFFSKFQKHPKGEPRKDFLPQEKRGVQTTMSTKALMIIAPADFRDEELFQTQKILESGGLQTEVVSQKKGLIRGVMGGQVQVEKILDDVSLTDYQAVIFVGGPGTTVYFDDEKVISFAKQAYGQGKIVAAICIAPVILAKSGILAGKKATVWSSPADKSYLDQLSKAGAILVNEPVVVDGQIITANGPTSAEQFGRQIKDLVKPS